MTSARNNQIKVDHELTELELNILSQVRSDLSNAASLNPASIRRLTEENPVYIDSFDIGIDRSDYTHLKAELALRLGAIAHQLVASGVILPKLNRVERSHAFLDMKHLNLHILGDTLRNLQAERDARYPQDGSTPLLEIYDKSFLYQEVGFRKKSPDDPMIFFADQLSIGITAPVIGSQKL